MTRYRCPQCSSTNLEVVVEVRAKLIQKDDGNFQTDTSTPDNGNHNHDWDSNSLMICNECGEEDIAEAFQYQTCDDRKSEVAEVVELGNSLYRLLASGWFADVELFYADESQKWCADVKHTNSTLPAHKIADLAVQAICGGIAGI